MKKITSILFAAVLSINFCKAQTTVRLQPSAAAGKDASIWSNATITYTPSYHSLTAYGWTNQGNPGIKRALVEFDLTSLPANIMVNNASLSLYYNPTDSVESVDVHSGNNACVIQRIVTQWNETTVDWLSQPYTTTQNEVQLPASTSSTQDYLNIDVTALVTDMVNDLSNSHGFMLKLLNENPYSILIFASSDNVDPTKHPKLEITYTQNTTTCIEMILDQSGIDAAVESQFPNINEGTHPNNFAMTWTCNSILCHMNGLMQFDLTSIPSTATIDSAYLKLYADVNNNASGIPGQPTFGSDNAGYVRRVTQSWGENTITWNNQPLYTTQNEAVLQQSSSLTENYVVNVRDLVQDMINNPASSFGFIIMEQNQNTYYNGLVFGSGDNADSNIFPRLKICYTNVSGIADISYNNNLIISPNPVMNELMVNGMKSVLERIEIYNVLGEKVYSEAVSDGSYKHAVNVSLLNSGIYFAKAVGEKEERVAKFVKQ